jgi:shikimate dehydrogenase
MHNAVFKELGLDNVYSTLSVHQDQLAEIIDTKIRSESFGGASVTIPYKIGIIKYMDELTESAKRAGAVNTIEKTNEILRGHNTDSSGGISALTEVHGNVVNSKVVIIGAGGAANALAAELASKVSELYILNRTVKKAKAISARLGGNIKYGSLRDQAIITSADILINTTPVGMSPNIGESPIEPKYLHSGLLVYDIIYNPLKTKLLLDAETVGARTLSGLWMLVYQGVEAFKIWTGLKPNAQTMYNAALEALEAMIH